MACVYFFWSEATILVIAPQLNVNLLRRTLHVDWIMGPDHGRIFFPKRSPTTKIAHLCTKCKNSVFKV